MRTRSVNVALVLLSFLLAPSFVFAAKAPKWTKIKSGQQTYNVGHGTVTVTSYQGAVIQNGSDYRTPLRVKLKYQPNQNDTYMQGKRGQLVMGTDTYDLKSKAQFTSFTIPALRRSRITGNWNGVAYSEIGVLASAEAGQALSGFQVALVDHVGNWISNWSENLRLHVNLLPQLPNGQ